LPPNDHLRLSVHKLETFWNNILGRMSKPCQGSCQQAIHEAPFDRRRQRGREANNLESEQNDVEVGFSGQGLGASYAHGIQRDVDQTNVHTLEIRFTQPGRNKVAGQEL
jgi:hypothetical protein